MSIQRAFSLVFERRPDLRFAAESFISGVSILFLYVYLICNMAYRLEGLDFKVLQWYLCRMEGWFATDADNISLKCWDQVKLLSSLLIHCL